MVPQLSELARRKVMHVHLVQQPIQAVLELAMRRVLVAIIVSIFLVLKLEDKWVRHALLYISSGYKSRSAHDDFDHVVTKRLEGGAREQKCRFCCVVCVLRNVTNWLGSPASLPCCCHGRHRAL